MCNNLISLLSKRSLFTIENTERNSFYKYYVRPMKHICLLDIYDDTTFQWHYAGIVYLDNGVYAFSGDTNNVSANDKSVIALLYTLNQAKQGSVDKRIVVTEQTVKI